MGPELLEPAVGLLCTFWVWKNVGATFFWSKWGFCPTENGEKLQKYGQNYPKWPKNGPNNGHFFHLGTHIIFEKPILTPNLSSFGHKMANLS